MRAVGLIPPWLRRGLEAGAIAALVALVTLLGGASGGVAGRIVLPSGPAGSLLLAPSVLAIGVMTAGYPVAFAATRAHAVLGSVAAFLLAANVVALVVTTQADMAGINRSSALGVLAGVLALGPALVGLAAGQALTPLGFGRRAGASTTVAASAAAAAILFLATRLG